MRKIFALILLMALVLGGCSPAGVPQEDYDKLLSERDALIVERDTLKAELEVLKADNETIAEDPSESISVFDAYVLGGGITLTNTDVQYDIENNIGEMFTLSGTAELSTYYNYGFGSSLEKNYFCMQVTPTGGTYSDSWYIYCNRDSFKDAFELLKSGSISIQSVCYIPLSNYKSGQGNMAALHYLAW